MLTSTTHWAAHQGPHFFQAHPTLARSRGADSSSCRSLGHFHLPEMCLTQSPADENSRTLAPGASPNHALEPKGETESSVPKTVTLEEI